MAKRKTSNPDTVSKTDDLINMNQAIEILKTTQPTFYRWLREGKIKGMKIGRQWRFHREDIERFLKGESPLVELPADIKPVLSSLRSQFSNSGEKIPPSSEFELQTAFDLMVHLAIFLHASDLHLDIFNSGGILRYRVDGVLHEIAQINPRLIPSIVEYWKSTCKLNVQEKSLPQDGRFLYDLNDKKWDIRVQVLPTALGETLVARFLDPSVGEVSLDTLPFRDDFKAKIKKHLEITHAVIICSGPTGSGKTTTLYALTNYLNKPEKKLVSIEDPVEYHLNGVNQIPINEARGLTFSAAMKSVMRSDPDVIMVGEIRNPETMHQVMTAALSGHVVLTQLHADTAINALMRLIDTGIQPFLMADSLKLIIGQRLLRKVCPKCSVKEKPPKDQIERAKERVQVGGLDWNEIPKNWVKPVGCSECAQLGYKGRTVVNEILEIGDEIRGAFIRGASRDELQEIAVRQGMVTLAAAAIRLAASGETTLQDALTVPVK